MSGSRARAMRASAALAAASCASAIACGSSMPPDAPPSPRTLNQEAANAMFAADAGTPAPAPRAQGPARMVVTVRAPERVAYDSRSLGPAMRVVTLRIANEGGRQLPLDGVTFSFAASREGVAFPCAGNAGPASALREGRTVAPGDAVELERVVDCKLTLSGHYALIVRTQDSENDAARDVAHFAVDVSDDGDAPRPYPARPGLFLRLTSASVARAGSLPGARATKRGEYPVVVAAINGGARPVRGGTGRLKLVVCQKDVKLPCKMHAVTLKLPDTIAPGAIETVDVPAIGAPMHEGDWVIDGRLVLDDEGDGVPIGRVGLQITRDATVIAPLPWPPVGDSRPWPGASR